MFLTLGFFKALSAQNSPRFGHFALYKFRVIIVIERERGGGEVNLAGKVKYLFLVTIDVYRLENRKIEVGWWGDSWVAGGPRERQVS